MVLPEYQTSLLNQVDGSSTISIGEVKVICSVSGPIEAKPRQELPTQCAIEVNIRPEVGVGSTREKNMEDKLRVVLNGTINKFQYPRQLIQVHLHIISKSQGTDNNLKDLHACINGAYLALIDANISLLSSFLSTYAVINDDMLIFNPTSEQIQSSISHHLVCFDIKSGRADELLFVDSVGEFTEGELMTVLDQSIEEIESMNKIVRKTITEKVSRDYIWKY
ncbi:hypothetical protein LJB42_002533 [Komagataella kurtzmanii]|nr:hypothetical protein LJB42_002533 [Komagataella kurtzmanii]